MRKHADLVGYHTKGRRRTSTSTKQGTRRGSAKGHAHCDGHCHCDFLEPRLLLSVALGGVAPSGQGVPAISLSNTLQYNIRPAVPGITPMTYYLTPYGYTVSQMRKAYGFGDLTNPGFTNRGDGQTIAVVLWNDVPTVTADLAQFSADVGLPAPSADNFQVVYAAGAQPPTGNQQIEVEADGDVETLHAIAPDAKIVLVEGASNSAADVYGAVDKAIEIVNAAGGGVVNMSWGAPEWASVSALESHFTNAGPNISFVAAAGDAPGEVAYPGLSPEVTSVGGTSLTLDSSGNRISESAWSSGGGGISAYMPAPSFQSGVTVNGSPLGANRAVPDVAFAADPGTFATPTGLEMYHSWTDTSGNIGYDLDFAGTSLAAPLFAGLVALANQQRVAAGMGVIGSALNETLYSVAQSNAAAAFNDIVTGSNSNPAYPGYDLATGWGSPKASALIQLLSGVADAPPVISSLAAFPGSTQPNNSFLLTANGVADSDGSVSSVTFYRESNGVPGLQITGPNADTQVGTGVPTGTTCSTVVSTAGMVAGTYTYYALATDNLGTTSATDASAPSATNTVVYPAPVLLAAADSGISSSDGITNFNNSSLGKALQCSIGSTISGATVTIYFNGTACGSAVAAGATTTISTDGSTTLADGTYAVTARQTLPGQAQSGDSLPLSITIDTTAPVIAAARQTRANANGWNNADVSVGYTASDGLSGLDSNSPSSGSFTFTAEGVSQSHTFTVTDVAGNVASGTVSGINIDKTAPTLTATPNAAPAASGWYNLATGAPTINFAASDNLSGGVSAPASVLLGEGANQTVSRTVTDLAGNTTSVTLTGLNVDLRPPTITAQRTTPPNGNGWNNTDVLASYTAGDGLSGLDSNSPASGSFTFTAQGAGQTHTFTVSDVAGNAASATVSNINIDKTPPTLTATPNTAPAAGGWYNLATGAPTITFAAGDGLSGGVSAPAPVLLGEGANQSVSRTVTDLAGNSTTVTLSSLNVDLTAPALTAAISPDGAPSGWYNLATGAPTITFAAGDALSGGVSVPAPVTLGEGANQSISRTVTDGAGNATTVSLTGLNVDLTPPTISAQRDIPPNANGWNNTNVDASYTASDALSGLASPASGGFTFSTQGANQSHTFTATDVAGNTASATVSGINIEINALTLSAGITPPAAGGWYNLATGAPTITFTVSDPLSDGFTVPDPVTLGDGLNQSVTRSVTDLAGNTSSVTLGDLNVDLTPPTIAVQRITPANANGWNNTSVVVSYTAGDGGSGLGPSAPASGNFTFTSQGAGQTHTFTVTDVAGNAASATISGINIDETAPTLTAAITPAAAATGWYNRATGAPTVTFTAGESLSGIATAPAPVIVGEGANQSVTRTVTDLAGNSASATVSALNVDLTAPAITAQRDTPPNADGSNNTSVHVSYTAGDGLSGLVSPASGSFVFPFSHQGAGQSHTFTVTDVAGNTASATIGGITITETAHQQYVNQLYHDLLQRDADPAGLAAWTTELDAGTSYQTVALAITGSQEYDANLVDSYYVTYLGRQAESGGLDYWVQQMQAGLSAETIRAGILGSNEYYARMGGTDSSFITALYRTFLGRDPEPGPTALPYWLGVLAAGNRTVVAASLSNSDENRRDIITAYYLTYLQRAPDAAGLAGWTAALANGMSQPAIISDFVTAPEYFALNGIA